MRIRYAIGHLAVCLLLTPPSGVLAADRGASPHRSEGKTSLLAPRVRCSLEYQRHRGTAKADPVLAGRKTRAALVCETGEQLAATSELQPNGELVVLLSAPKESNSLPIDFAFLTEVLPLLTEGLPGIKSISTLSEGQQFVVFSSAMILTEAVYSVRGEHHEARFVFAPSAK